MLWFAAAIAGLVLLAMIGSARRIGWLGRSRKHSFPGSGSSLDVLNEVFQPQMPTVEHVQKLHEGEEEREDEGDPPEPTGPVFGPRKRLP